MLHARLNTVRDEVRVRLQRTATDDLVVRAKGVALTGVSAVSGYLSLAFLVTEDLVPAALGLTITAVTGLSGISGMVSGSNKVNQRATRLLDLQEHVTRSLLETVDERQTAYNVTQAEEMLRRIEEPLRMRTVIKDSFKS